MELAGKGFGDAEDDQSPLEVVLINGKSEDVDVDTILRLKLYHTLFFSMLGLVIMISFSLTTWYLVQPTTGYDAYIDDPNLSTSIRTLIFVGQALISASTLVTIILILQQYYIALLQKRAEWSGVPFAVLLQYEGDSTEDYRKSRVYRESFKWMWSSLMWKCLGEILVHLIHPTLWLATRESVSVTKSVDGVPNLLYKLFQFFMFFRLYLLFVVLHMRSTLFRQRYTIVGAVADLRGGFRFNVQVTLKILFYARPLESLIVAITAVLMVFGYSIFMTERKEDTDAVVDVTFTPLVSVWFSYVTFATVGYGDYTPKSLPGRILAALVAGVGITAFIIFSAVLANLLSLSSEQKYAMEYIQTREANIAIENAAASLIQQWMLFHYHRIHPEKGAASQAKLNKPRMSGHKSNKLYYTFKKFRSARRKMDDAITQTGDSSADERIAAICQILDSLEAELRAQNSEVEALHRMVDSRLRELCYRLQRHKASLPSA